MGRYFPRQNANLSSGLAPTPTALESPLPFTCDTKPPPRASTVPGDNVAPIPDGAAGEARACRHEGAEDEMYLSLLQELVPAEDQAKEVRAGATAAETTLVGERGLRDSI